MSADAVMLPLAPKFTVATAEGTGAVLSPGCLQCRHWWASLTKATMSGTGVAEAEERSIVFSPVAIGRRAGVRASRKLHLQYRWGLRPG